MPFRISELEVLSQALPAITDMVVVETLKNMNQTTAKHASWIVRVLGPRVTAYEFMENQ